MKESSEEVTDSPCDSPWSGAGGGHVYLGFVGGQPDGEVSVSWQALDAGVE